MKRLSTWLVCAVAALGLSLAAGCGSSAKKGDTMPASAPADGVSDDDNPCGANPCGDAEGGEPGGGDGAAPDGDANDEEGEEEPEP